MIESRIDPSKHASRGLFYQIQTESDEDGNFFITVPGNKDYELIVVAPAYKEYRHAVRVNLNADGSTATTNHSISLETK